MRTLLAALLAALCIRRSFAKVRHGFVDHLRQELGASSPRKWIVGGMMGSGKTTFSRSLADALGVPHIEIDVYGVPPSESTEAKVLEAVARAQRGWVAEANPWQIPAALAKEAEVVVFLDYDNIVSYLRLLRRGCGRWLSDGLSWAGFKHFVVDEAVLDLGRIVYRYGKANRNGWREAGLLEGIDRASTICVRCVSPAELRLVHELVVLRLTGV
jgi:adenylate kinase family enzyme